MPIRKLSLNIAQASKPEPAVRTMSQMFVAVMENRTPYETLDDGVSYYADTLTNLSNMRNNSFKSLDDYTLASTNITKNRYSNIFPFYKTQPNITDPALRQVIKYFNGNISTVCGIDFLVTQAPTTSSIADFWYIVLTLKCPLIANITRFIDENRPKSIRYWPLYQNESTDPLYEQSVEASYLTLAYEIAMREIQPKQGQMFNAFATFIEKAHEEVPLENLSWNSTRMRLSVARSAGGGVLEDASAGRGQRMSDLGVPSLPLGEYVSPESTLHTRSSRCGDVGNCSNCSTASVGSASTVSQDSGHSLDAAYKNKFELISARAQDLLASPSAGSDGSEGQLKSILRPNRSATDVGQEQSADAVVHSKLGPGGEKPRKLSLSSKRDARKGSSLRAHALSRQQRDSRAAEDVPDAAPDDIVLNTTAVAVLEDEFIRYSIGIKYDEESHNTNLYYYGLWDDFAAPSNFEHVFRFADDILACATGRPIVIHCSAGVGRSSTFVVCICILKQVQEMVAARRPVSAADRSRIWYHMSPPIVDMVEILRVTRNPICVQTVEQFVFLHEFANFCYAKLSARSGVEASAS